MNELDRQIRATLQTLVALQGAKIIQLEREKAMLIADCNRFSKENHELKLKYADRISGSKQEAQA